MSYPTLCPTQVLDDRPDKDWILTLQLCPLLRTFH
jgi:hypothetical protein